MMVPLLHLLLPRNRLGDAIFSGLKFVKNHKRLPRPWKPTSFNDHLFRLKVSGELYDPLRQLISDKILVKEYIRGVLGDGYTPRTLQILSTPETQFLCAGFGGEDFRSALLRSTAETHYCWWGFMAVRFGTCTFLGRFGPFRRSGTISG